MELEQECLNNKIENYNRFVIKHSNSCKNIKEHFNLIIIENNCEYV